MQEPDTRPLSFKEECQRQARVVAEADAANLDLEVFMDAALGDLEHEKRHYDAFLQHKVDAARKSVRAGEGLANEDVEAEFAALPGLPLP